MPAEGVAVRARRFGPLVLIAVALASPARAQESPRVWITTASALVGQAADLAITANGKLYVLDRLSSTVLVLSRPGVVDRTIGEKGSGPGEFQGAVAIQPLAKGGLEVVDRGNDRLQRFDSTGAYLSSRRLPPFGGYYPVAVSPEGVIAVNTLHDSTLVALYDTTGSLIVRLARAPASMPGSVSMSAVRREVLEGKVPDFFRNTVQPAFAPDGGLWLAHLTDASVEKWSNDGNREAALELSEPEMESIRAAFFQRYRDPQLRGLPSLTYIADLYPTTTGCWVLLRGGDTDAAVILKVSNTGMQVGRWKFDRVKGANLLAVDERRNAIYFSVAPAAEVVEVRTNDAGR